MNITLNYKKQEILNQLISDINSNNRYVGDGYKIAGKIDNERIHLNLEDRNGKNSKFSYKAFYGTVTSVDEKTVIQGKFRIHTFALVLLLVLLVVALESFAVSIIFHGFTTDLIFSAFVMIVVLGYFITINKKSNKTNEYIKNYISSLQPKS